jgi:hypothetical protein
MEDKGDALFAGCDKPAGLYGATGRFVALGKQISGASSDARSAKEDRKPGRRAARRDVAVLASRGKAKTSGFAGPRSLPWTRHPAQA